MAEEGTFDGRPILVAHLAFLATVILHAADHIQRGTGSLPRMVFWGGIALAVFQFGSLAFTIPGHPKAPLVAMVVGFGTAASTTLSHLAPHWSAISNPYPSLEGLSAFSWTVMLAEIGAAIVFGLVGVREFRRQDVVALTR